MKQTTKYELMKNINDVLSYDPDTGVFKWKVNRRIVKAGDVAGTIRRGYVVIGMKKRKFLAHRLAWLAHYGKLPEQNIDHINGNPSDNRIENLREVTQQQNLQNIRKAKSNSQLGIKGVGWSKASKKYRARIMVDGVDHNLGDFETIQEAVSARREAEKKMCTHSPLHLIQDPCYCQNNGKCAEPFCSCEEKKDE